MSCHRKINAVLTALGGSTATGLGVHQATPEATGPWAEAKRAWRTGRQWTPPPNTVLPTYRQVERDLLATGRQVFLWLAGETDEPRPHYPRDAGYTNALVSLAQSGATHHCARCGAFTRADGTCMRAGCGGRDEGEDSPGAQWARQYLAQWVAAFTPWSAENTPPHVQYHQGEGCNAPEFLNPDGSPRWDIRLRLRVLATASNGAEQSFILARGFTQRPVAPRVVGPAAAGSDLTTQAEQALYALGAFRARDYLPGVVANLPPDTPDVASIPPAQDTTMPLLDTALRRESGEVADFNRLMETQFQAGQRMTDEDLDRLYGYAVRRLGYALRLGAQTLEEWQKRWSGLQAVTLARRARGRTGYIDTSALMDRLQAVQAQAAGQSGRSGGTAAGGSLSADLDQRGRADQGGPAYRIPAPPAEPEGEQAPLFVRLEPGLDTTARRGWAAAGFAVWSEVPPDRADYVVVGLDGGPDADLNADVPPTNEARYQALGDLAPPIGSGDQVDQVARWGVVEVASPLGDGTTLLVPGNAPFLGQVFSVVRGALRGPTYRLFVYSGEVLYGREQQEGGRWRSQDTVPRTAAATAVEAMQRLHGDVGVVEVVHNTGDGRWYVRDADTRLVTAADLERRILATVLRRALVSNRSTS